MYPRQEQPHPIPPLPPPATTTMEHTNTHSLTAPSSSTDQAMLSAPQSQRLSFSNNGSSSSGTGTSRKPNGRSGATSDGRMYSLHVEQQPVRARMCGFGDKDRRPITPPPCIRLLVRDAATGKEVDFNEVDSTFFVLTVDLWSADGGTEVNLVRQSSASPTAAISTATTTSYPPPPERPQPQMVAMLGHNQLALSHAYAQAVASNQMPVHAYVPPPQYGNPYYPPTPGTPLGTNNYPYAQPGPPHGGYAPMPGIPMPPPTSATGMFTRNLIGSLTVNAFRLTDTEGKVGFWFILQDLSVRTEGSFRLKMNFVDVGGGSGNTLNTGKAPVLATTFSDVFQVYSAKKFPGVIESTPLSKAFAAQGIKIPIRKDGPKQLSSQVEDF